VLRGLFSDDAELLVVSKGLHRAVARYPMIQIYCLLIRDFLISRMHCADHCTGDPERWISLKPPPLLCCQRSRMRDQLQVVINRAGAS
jgi:hypothetical protein